MTAALDALIVLCIRLYALPRSRAVDLTPIGHNGASCRDYRCLACEALARVRGPGAQAYRATIHGSSHCAKWPRTERSWAAVAVHVAACSAVAELRAAAGVSLALASWAAEIAAPIERALAGHKRQIRGAVQDAIQIAQAGGGL